MNRYFVLLAGTLLPLACGDDATGPDFPTPFITSVMPSQGTVGTEVRIQGSDFASEVEVRFGDLASPRVLWQGGALFALAPRGLQPNQSYRVRVLNGGEEGDTANAVFLAVPPRIASVNGVSKPTGLQGMTVIVEGSAFSDSLGLSDARVFFQGADGTPLATTIADSTRDWTDGFVVTTVPNGIPDVSRVWVETPTGVSDPVEFRLLQSGVFSPSLINWTPTTALPQPLQGLGAVFVPVEQGLSPANYVFVVGGVGSLEEPTNAVYRARATQNGAIAGAWDEAAPLPGPRAYHVVAAATPFTALLDTLTTAAFVYSLGGISGDGEATDEALFSHVGLDGAPGPWQATAPLPLSLHSASAVVFRGFLYLAGGAGSDGAPLQGVYRAAVGSDGALGPWESLPALPESVAYSELVGFGPFLYAIGGDTGASPPVRADLSGTETSAVHFARVDVRTGLLEGTWTPTQSMGKARSKHSAVFAGGALFVTSGIYAGQPGSSENRYAWLNSDGTIQPWSGATGSETIDVELGISLYNQAVVTFIDEAGFGHVLVLGGADRESEGTASAGVVYY